MSRYITHFSTCWSQFLTRWVGDYNEDSNHRLKWRRNISLVHPTSITSTTEFFWSQPRSYTTSLEIYIPKCHFTRHWTENDLLLVFWLFKAPLFRYLTKFQTPSVQNHRQTWPLWYLSPRYKYLWIHSSFQGRQRIPWIISHLRRYPCCLLAR